MGCPLSCPLLSYIVDSLCCMAKFQRAAHAQPPTPLPTCSPYAAAHSVAHVQPMRSRPLRCPRAARAQPPTPLPTCSPCAAVHSVAHVQPMRSRPLRCPRAAHAQPSTPLPTCSPCAAVHSVAHVQPVWNARCRTYLIESSPWVSRFIIPQAIATHQELQTWLQAEMLEANAQFLGGSWKFEVLIRGFILTLPSQYPSK